MPPWVLLAQMHPADESTATWSELLAQRLEAQRVRLREAQAGQRKQAEQFTQSLHAQLAEIHEALQSADGEVTARDAKVVQELARLEREEDRLTAQDADLARHRSDLEKLRTALDAGHKAQVAQQQALLDELGRSLSQLHQREATLAQQQADLAAAHAELDGKRRGCDETERRQQQREQRLATRESELARQTEQLREREAAFGQREQTLQQRTESLDQRQSALSQREQALREAQSAATDRETELARRQSEIDLSVQRMRGQRSSVAQELRARRKEILAEAERMRAEAAQTTASGESLLALQLAQAKAELACVQAGENAQSQKQLELEERLDEARRELAVAAQRIKEAEQRPASAVPDSSEADNLRKRLELALADVRDLKRRNAELAEQARNRPAASVPAIAAVGDDWEARKQRMLAQLESDFDDGDSRQKAEKLTIEQAIEETERIIAAKDEEIAELQRLLAEQSGNIGGVAIGAAAIAQMLDADELIRQERESLRELQEKLREQLRAAEIDISVERAKMARERALLDEKSHELEQRRQNPPAVKEEGKPKSGGSRWLQRLGLRDEEK